MKRSREEEAAPTKVAKRRILSSLEVFHSSSKGRRLVFEDEYISFSAEAFTNTFWNHLRDDGKELILPLVSFHAIFDGHGGKDTANFVKEALPKNFAKIIEAFLLKKKKNEAQELTRDEVKQVHMIVYMRMHLYISYDE